MKKFFKVWYSPEGGGGGGAADDDGQDGAGAGAGEDGQDGGQDGGQGDQGPTDEELDQQAYERLQQRHGYLFEGKQQDTDAGGKKDDLPEKKEIWDMTPEEITGAAATQSAQLTTRMMNNRDEVMEQLSTYDPEVRKAARALMNGMSPKDLADRNAPALILRMAIGETVLSGKAIKTKAPTRRDDDSFGEGDDIGAEASVAEKLMGVTFSAKELREAGIRRN